jgi:hypothetical protein
MRDVRDIHVIGIRGQHDGDTGVISIWPIFDRQDWVNVLWSDGTVETAHDGDFRVPNEAEQINRHNRVNKRITELSRMNKHTLLMTMTRLSRYHGVSYVIGGPRLWTKDELINGILRLEFNTETG